MMGDAVPQTPWDLSLSFSRMDVFFFTANGTCRTIEMLDRNIGQRRDATRAPIQARNGWRPHGRRLGQPAAPSKDRRFFVQTTRTTSLMHIQPESMTEARIFVLMRMYLDTGARAEELLALRRSDVNLQDQLIKITGKGGRERQVPFQQLVRADIQRWMNLTPDAPPTAYLFPTRQRRGCNTPAAIARAYHACHDPKVRDLADAGSFRRSRAIQPVGSGDRRAEAVAGVGQKMIVFSPQLVDRQTQLPGAH